jgi:hypothetical protein
MKRRTRVALPLGLVAVLGTAGLLTAGLASSSTGTTTPPTGGYSVYTIKYNCGEFGKTAYADVPEGPYAPGFYQTAINIHYTALPPQIDPSNQTAIMFYKKAVLDFAAGSTNAPATETSFEANNPYSAPLQVQLAPDSGMLIDCQDIRAVILKQLPARTTAPAAPTFIEGDVVLMVPLSQVGQTGKPLAPLNVNAVYTANSWNCVPASTTSTTCRTPVQRTGITEDVVTYTPVQVQNP